MNAEKKEQMWEEDKILGMSKLNFYLLVILISVVIFLVFQYYSNKPTQVDQNTLNSLPSMNDQVNQLGVKIYTIPYNGQDDDKRMWSIANETGLVPFVVNKPNAPYGEVCNGYVPFSQPIRQVVMKTTEMDNASFFCAQTTFEYDQIEISNTSYDIGFTTDECNEAGVDGTDGYTYLNLSYIKQTCIKIPFKGEPRFAEGTNL